MSELSQNNSGVVHDPWRSLRDITQARIGLGRTGVSVPLKETLDFKLAHARARQAIYTELDQENLTRSVTELVAQPVLPLKSQATTREEYLKRPDLGRRLSEDSSLSLRKVKPVHCDVAVTIADGLSATAVNAHAVPVLRLTMEKLFKAGISLAPITIVEQGRVAISDDIGFILGAKVAVILIGERPGLSSPDSLGIYLTYDPSPGKTDESRNCISNIRPQGMSYALAAEKLFYLISQSLQMKLSGVNLKDDLHRSPELT